MTIKRVLKIVYPYFKRTLLIFTKQKKFVSGQRLIDYKIIYLSIYLLKKRGNI